MISVVEDPLFLPLLLDCLDVHPVRAENINQLNVRIIRCFIHIARKIGMT